MVNKNDASVNQYIDLADVRDGFIYSKNNTIFTAIKMYPMSTSLLTIDEKRSTTLRMTREISPIATPFKLLFLSQPADVSKLVNYYEDLKNRTDNPTKKDSLIKTRDYISKMSVSSKALERQTFMILWSDSNIEELQRKTQDMEKALNNAQIPCKRLKDTDLINMLGLFYNPAFSSDKSTIDVTPNITFLEESLNADKERQ